MNNSIKPENRFVTVETAKNQAETENEVMNEVENEIRTLRTILRQMFGY